MRDITLRVPALDDSTWKFSYDVASLTYPRQRPNVTFGRVISLSIEGIVLRIAEFPSNRVLNLDDPRKFILLSIDRRLRFPDQPVKVAVEYILRMFKKGVLLNGVQYRFYGHSNSQLVRFQFMTWLSNVDIMVAINRREDALAFYEKQTQMPNSTTEFIGWGIFKGL
jgi:hypothetical protein